MGHQLGEGENRKKKVETAAEQQIQPLVEGEDTFDEIDPADLFDPEEFGYRRGGFHDRP